VASVLNDSIIWKSQMATVLPPSARYIALVQEHPLRVIHSEAEYDRAIAIIDRLSDRGGQRTGDEAKFPRHRPSSSKNTIVRQHAIGDLVSNR
jgi:hypothetical protein